MIMIMADYSFLTIVIYVKKYRNLKYYFILLLLGKEILYMMTVDNHSVMMSHCHMNN